MLLPTISSFVFVSCFAAFLAVAALLLTPAPQAVTAGFDALLRGTSASVQGAIGAAEQGAGFVAGAIDEHLHTSTDLSGVHTALDATSSSLEVRFNLTSLASDYGGQVVMGAIAFEGFGLLVEVA